MQQRTCWISAIITVTAATVMAMTISGTMPVYPAQKQEGMQDRLKKLEDREAIRNLLMDYGKYLDQRDFDAFSGLFAEKDGEWIGGMGKAKGRQAILKMMEDSIGRDTKGLGASNYHIFTNETIRINGDRAEANTKWIFVVPAESGRPQPFYLGHYEDTFVRENGEWKFQRRLVYGDIPKDDPLAK